jgi:hypothetical protein
MKVQFHDAAMLDVSGTPVLVQKGQTVQLESALAVELVRAGLASAVAETTDASSERSHVCTQFQQSGAPKRLRLRQNP